MELYLVRHGIAEEDALGGDAARRLTPEGREKVLRVAKCLKEQEIVPELVLHSPYIRARETAELLASELGSPLERVDGFRPMDPPRDSLRLLERLSGKKSLMVVSHEPHLACLASLLLSGKDQPMLSFKKAGVACLDWPEKGPAHLLFLLMPKFLALLLALFVMPSAFADDKGRRVLDLYNQMHRELSSLGAPAFSSLCAFEFPGVPGNAICEDLFEQACKDSKGKDADLMAEMKEKVAAARDRAARELGYEDYRAGAKQFLEKNGVRLAKEDPADALTKLLEDKDADPEVLVADPEECDAAGVSAPSALRERLVNHYAADLPAFLSDRFYDVCDNGPSWQNKHPRELNAKIYEACENFPRIKARAIELFRREGSAEAARESRQMVEEYYRPLVRQDESEEAAAKRVAEEFCKDLGRAMKARARRIAKEFRDEIGRSEPVVKALTARYYSARNREVADAMITSSRESIGRLLQRLTGDGAKAARIREQYAAAELFWISPPPREYWTNSNLGKLRVLDAERMETDPRDTSYWDVFLDGKLSHFADFNASYDTAKSWGASQRRERVTMLPGMLLLLEMEPMAFLSILGHEMGHKIGPEVSRTNGHDLNPEWKDLLACYGGRDSLRLQRNQQDETIADFVGSEVIADAIGQLPQAQRRGALLSAMQSYCRFDDGANAEFHVNCRGSHPANVLRVNGVIGANPRIREAIGCEAAQKNYKNCGLTKAAGAR